MSIRHNISHKFLLILPVSAILLFGFFGCKDEVENKKPFVRLIEDQSIHSKIFNREIKYAVLLPKEYENSNDSFPVVYLLHGYGDDQTAWYKGGMIQYYSDLHESENGPMIFVMPQAFNSYYVNRWNGSLPYMDYFTTELVPAIDSIYRTKKDKTQRAVMGYSMGGYGAFILPFKNPDLFSISVPLSMSFRTDEQYLAESQDVFDNQWALIFGGLGTSGLNRITAYFKTYSPFHFLIQDDPSTYSDLKILVDCGDDEESLSITNGELHNLLSDRNIAHEYRTRNGAHSWDYWHKSLPEALNFISYGFKGLQYPSNPNSEDIGAIISDNQYQLVDITGTDIQVGVFKPSNYDISSAPFPVIFFLNDYQNSNRKDFAFKVISLLNNAMISGQIRNSVIVEIPSTDEEINSTSLATIFNQIKTNFLIIGGKKGRVLIGNGRGGEIIAKSISQFSESIDACFLYNSSLSETVDIVSSVYYYVQLTDKSKYYKGNFYLYEQLHSSESSYEYRVDQGDSSQQSVINGIKKSLDYLSKKLVF